MTYYVRNLPHWQPAGKDIFITWRLHGSFPSATRIPNPSDQSPTPGERFRAYDRVLDRADIGPLWLRDPRVAECVVAALQKGQTQGLFRIHSYVVMPNHVHVLLEPTAPVSQITRIVKGATAREANRILHFTGKRFWEEESFDHWIRNTSEWNRVRTYIEHNPVRAGLVQKPEDWPWSSFSRKQHASQ